MLRLARWSYRLGRRAAILAALVVIHFSPYLFALRFALTRGALTAPIASAVGKQLGVRARVADSVVYFRDPSRLTGVRLYEPGQSEPFLVAGRVEADLNVFNYLRGRSVRWVDLSDVHVRLRFDAAGRPLTKPSLPEGKKGPLPAMRARDARLTIEQEGREPFTLDGISLTLEPGKPYELFGVIDDPVWGPIDVAGSLDPRTMATSLRLTSEGMDVDPGKLGGLPFVPPKAWEWVELKACKAPLSFELAMSNAIPRVRYRVEFSRVVAGLRRPGRPTFYVAPAAGVLAGNEEGFRLDGTIEDPKWGKWAVEAGLESRRGELAFSLDAPAVQVDQARLEELPFVPALTWEQVKVATGETSARVEVRASTKEQGRLRYRVDLGVSRADVFVPSLDLPISAASGEVVVEDGQVWLRKVTGTAAAGRIGGDAEFDFRQEAARLRFLLAADAVRVGRLPPKWKLPAALIDGKVRGKADLTVTVRGGRAEPTGTGTARIEEARLLGFPTKEPIELELRADGSGIEFAPRSPSLKKLMDAARLSAAPAGDVAGPACVQVARATDRVARGASWALNWLGAKPPPAPAQKQPYVDASFALDDVDLDELFRRLEWVPPPQLRLSGKLSLRLRVGVPFSTSSPGDLKEVRALGEASLQRLSIVGVEVRDLSAKVEYRDGVLTLDRLTGYVGGGAFSGRAVAGLYSGGTVAVGLAARAVPLEAVLGKQAGLAAILSGQLTAAVPLAEAGRPSAWRGAASLRDAKGEVWGVAVRGLSADLALMNGTLTASDVRAEVGSAPLRGWARVGIEKPYAVKAEMSLPGADLAALRGALPEEWRWLEPGGRVEVEGAVSGTLSPAALSGQGKLAARDLRAWDFRADALSLRYEFQEQAVALRDIDARLYHGSVTGSATLPLERGGDIRLDLSAQDIEVREVGAALKLPVALGGKVSARANLSARRDGEQWRGEVKAQAKTIAVRSAVVRNVEGEVKWRGKRVQYHLGGQTMGGEVSLDGSYPPPAMRPAGAHDGKLRFDRVLLRGLAKALGGGEEFRPLDGVAWLEIPFDHEGGKVSPKGMGRVVLRDLRWADRELADDVIGYVRLTGDGFVVRDVTSSFAGGLLRVTGAYRLNDPTRSYISLTLTGAESSRLTAFAGQSKEYLSGPVNLNLRFLVGQEWAGSGSVVLPRGKVAGVDVNEWRAPFDFRFDPGQGRLELNVRDSQAQVGTGRAQLEASLTVARTMRVRGKVQFFDAGLKSLSGVVGDVSTYASGRVTGRVDFSGSDMASLAELNATIQAKMSDAQALQLPVLSYLVPYLVPGQGATTFQTGEVKAQLSRGVLRVREFSLESPVVVLMMQGTVTLQQGRLDLDVMARTSPFGNLDPLSLRLLLRQVPAVGPVPVGAIVRATQLFAERSVYLRVGGTMKTPVVRVEPLRTLSDEAVRFFLGRAVGTLPLP